MTIAAERTETLKAMCEAFKFIEDLAGSTGSIAPDKDNSRSDEIDAADVVGSIRLIYKTYQKREEKQKQMRNNRIDSHL